MYDFYKAFAATKTANSEYRDKAEKWEERYGEKAQRREEIVHRRLQNYQREKTDKQMNRISRSKDRGVR